MIPKIIHYAWFGSKIPQNVQERIDNWKKFIPDWQFKLWNENNYDLRKSKFSNDMYEKSKFGYVTDELRYDVLNKFGGFYLDTDIVIKKKLDPFLDANMVWGFLYDNSLETGIIGSIPNQKVLQDILDVYNGSKFPDIYDNLYHMTSNPIVTKIFMNEFNCFKTNGKKQVIDSKIMIYPKDYFTYCSKRDNANYAEHLFDNSWGVKNKGIYGKTKFIYKKLFPYSWAKISAKRGIKKAKIDGIPLEK